MSLLVTVLRRLTHHRFVLDTCRCVSLDTKTAAAVGFGACMPQMPTALSAAGDETLFCYLLHVPLTPAIQSAFAVGLLEAASADARSPRRGAVALLYMLAVQIALSRKPRVALPRWRWGR